MPKDVISLLVYQIDGNKLQSPGTFGIPVKNIVGPVRPTRVGSTWKKADSNVDNSIYKFISAGVPVRNNGYRGMKMMYTNKTVADIIADINT